MKFQSDFKQRGFVSITADHGVPNRPKDASIHINLDPKRKHPQV